jgi:hypothetical protein
MADSREDSRKVYAAGQQNRAGLKEETRVNGQGALPAGTVQGHNRLNACTNSRAFCPFALLPPFMAASLIRSPASQGRKPRSQEVRKADGWQQGLPGEIRACAKF